MCGLFGLASSTLSPYELDVLKMMSHLTSLRGTDSTGICTVTFNKKKDLTANVRKGVITPSTFIYSKTIQEYLLADRLSAVLGHNRHATLGKISNDNAHPFRCKHIIGMHNGTVGGIVPKNSDKTDSQILYEHMAEQGLESTLDFIKNGAYALVWLDYRDSTINFYRNGQRPLYYMYTPGGTVMWMSERWMLDVIKDKMNWSSGTPVLLDSMTHYRIKVGTHMLSKVEVENKYRQPFHTHTQASVPLLPGPTSKFEKVSTITPAGYPYQTRARAFGQATQIRKFAGPDGLPITAVEYHELTKCGCVFCEKKVKLFEPIHWCTDPMVLQDGERVAFFCDECVVAKNYSYVNLSMFELTEGKVIYAS